jgi:hypothetical protein
MLSNLIRNDCSTKSLSAFLTHVSTLIDHHRLDCPVKKADFVVEAVGCDLSDLGLHDADEFGVIDMDDALADTPRRASHKLKFPRKFAIEEIQLDVYGHGISFLNRRKPIYVLLDVANVMNLVKAIKFSMRSHYSIPDAPLLHASSSALATPLSAVAAGVADADFKEPGCYYNYINRNYQVKYWSRDADKYCWSSRGLLVSSVGNHLEAKSAAKRAAIKLWNELDQSLTPRIKLS